MTDMKSVPFHDNVWPKFLRDNARKVLEARRLNELAADHTERSPHPTAQSAGGVKNE